METALFHAVSLALAATRKCVGNADRRVCADELEMHRGIYAQRIAKHIIDVSAENNAVQPGLLVQSYFSNAALAVYNS